MFARLVCAHKGHEWTERPGAIPEDRDSYQCERCAKWAYDPPNAGHERLPKEVTE